MYAGECQIGGGGVPRATMKSFALALRRWWNDTWEDHNLHRSMSTRAWKILVNGARSPRKLAFASFLYRLAAVDWHIVSFSSALVTFVVVGEV